MIEPTALREVYMFGRLSEGRLTEVAVGLKMRQFAAGTVLFHKGDPGDELFIVQDGSVGIFEPSADKPGEEKPIRIFRAGEVFGEMGLIDFHPRTLSARALEPTRTLVLKGDDFRMLLRDHDIALSVMAALNDRIRYTTEFLSELQGWIGRVAMGQYGPREFLDEVQSWVKQATRVEYRRSLESGVRHRDPGIAALAAEFAQMAAQVQQREDVLRQEIAQLRIEIDEAKKERQVAEIVESDYFQSLKAQARDLRRKRE